jgi:RNA polymerase sigma factor (sigma-70 family)
MTMNSLPLAAASDEQLWQKSIDGDREAFGRIVERYQSLVCSLAYSACGNLTRSEDFAQEAFVAAWQKLGELREPAKLRAWLCGIVRHLTANALRRDRRRGVVPNSLDDTSEPVSAEADPADQAVTQEEAVLLWRSLGGTARDLARTDGVVLLAGTVDCRGRGFAGTLRGSGPTTARAWRSRSRHPNGSRPTEQSLLGSLGRRVMARLRFPNPTSPP